MHIVLIPGLWLDGSSWDRVVPVLEQAGHMPHALTLPGMEAKDADRSGVTLQDHVAAVVAAIDAVPEDDGKVLVVGHSLGSALAYAAADARPDRVARTVYIGGFPATDGEPLGAFAAENGEIPLPSWEDIGEDDLEGLDDAARADFRARAVPSPERVTTDPVRLTSERRYDVPVTVICPEFSADQLRRWIDGGEPSVQEFTRLRDVEYVDLPTGHWPQFSRPEDLGRAIVDAAAKPGGVTVIDEHGRPEPPLDGDELATLTGFLDYQRATLAWKCRGLDAAGLAVTVGASTMTLGGLLKHLAFVEDDWFTRSLFDRERSAPWNTVDWAADNDWDWHSAADDTPEQLFALWEESVDRSRANLAEALAEGGLDRPARRVWPDGRAPSLRWILTHMIEEYARHNGHADLLREAVDGSTGE